MAQIKPNMDVATNNVCNNKNNDRTNVIKLGYVKHRIGLQHRANCTQHSGGHLHWQHPLRKQQQQLPHSSSGSSHPHSSSSNALHISSFFDDNNNKNPKKKSRRILHRQQLMAFKKFDSVLFVLHFKIKKNDKNWIRDYSPAKNIYGNSIQHKKNSRIYYLSKQKTLTK